ARADKLAELSVTITRKASDEGKLFGSVSNIDVAEAITEAGVDVSKAEVRMPEGAIREIGEFDIAIHLHTDIDSAIKLVVAAD
ncbi:MAG: 50S ribosomal protein L9, partial [Gammaproteobacteria bacterium]|nr:50S ribosomal protein L9 [Gammaproteobacteria bacterium]